MPRFFALVISLACLWSNPVRALTYNEIVRDIQAAHVTSLEDLLPRLPLDFRANYTALYDSRSTQFASITEPRVILFGQDARLTCAFNGGRLRGGDTLECFQFNDQARTFDFRQIRFPTAANGLSEVKFSESGFSTDKRVSCTACHAEDTRPNWDAYSRWPGAFGENDDVVTVHDETYPQFVAARGTHPRYKWLSQDRSNARAPYGDGVDITTRPNLRFSDLVGRMNALRALRLMEAQLPRWQVLGFARASLNCDLSKDDLRRLGTRAEKFQTDTSRQVAFDALNTTHFDWTTQIFSDPEPHPEIFDHQSGYGTQTIDMGMLIVRELSLAPGSRIGDALRAMKAQAESSGGGAYSGDAGNFFYQLNTFFVSYSTFDDPIPHELESVICPELNTAAVSAYLKR